MIRTVDTPVRFTLDFYVCIITFSTAIIGSAGKTQYKKIKGSYRVTPVVSPHGLHQTALFR